MVEGSTSRLQPGDFWWMQIGEARSIPGRTTLVSTGIVEGLAGACLAQHGCCVPQGMAGKLTVTNRVVTTRGRSRGQQEWSRAEASRMAWVTPGSGDPTAIGTLNQQSVARTKAAIDLWIILLNPDRSRRSSQ
jgi:hypothetical protein